jgi:selenide,water dikinase
MSSEPKQYPPLSSFASAGGCACKLSQNDLRSVLSRLPGGAANPDLLVGYSTNDDAAVLRIDHNRAIVQTLDFFTPIVDDPFLFGAIAATNAISDVYAMGAEPILALAIAAFPSEKLPLETLHQILAGGEAKAREAGFPIAGGHTIIDDVPKYGLAVTGIVDIDRVVRNSTAKAGDALYLTKPIGGGILVCAHRASVGASMRGEDRAGPDLTEATNWMTMLNRDASKVMVDAGVDAATDVTGYGLIGHLLEVCIGSGVGATVSLSAVPLMAEVRRWLDLGLVPGGTRRNADGFRNSVRSNVTDADYLLLCDAQTSGGLLMAVAPANEEALVAGFRQSGLFYARIGETTDDRGRITIEP